MSAYTITLGFIIIGFLLILAEIFIIPGFNVFGIGGFICVAVGIYFAYDRLDPLAANTILLVSLGTTVFIIWFFFKFGAYKRFILSEEQGKSAGYVGSQNLDGYLHKEATVITPLRPAGTVSIGEDRIQNGVEISLTVDN